MLLHRVTMHNARQDGERLQRIALAISRGVWRLQACSNEKPRHEPGPFVFNILSRSCAGKNAVHLEWVPLSAARRGYALLIQLSRDTR